MLLIFSDIRMALVARNLKHSSATSQFIAHLSTSQSTLGQVRSLTSDAILQLSYAEVRRNPTRWQTSSVLLWFYKIYTCLDELMFQVMSYTRQSEVSDLVWRIRVNHMDQTAMVSSKQSAFSNRLHVGTPAQPSSSGPEPCACHSGNNMLLTASAVKSKFVVHSLAIFCHCRICYSSQYSPYQVISRARFITDRVNILLGLCGLRRGTKQHWQHPHRRVLPRICLHSGRGSP